MPHHYVCNDLNDLLKPLWKPEETRYSQRPRLFVLPSRALDPELWIPGNPHQQLAGLIEGRDQNPFGKKPWTLKEKEKSYTVFAETTADRIQSFAAAVCNAGNKAVDAILFVNGPVFRRLHDLISLSHILLDAYWVWDQGEEGEWPQGEQEKFTRAWQGAGWLALEQELRCPGISEDCFYRMRPELDKAAEGVARRWAESQSSAVARYPTEPKRLVAHHIARFLPRYREDENGPWRRYGSNSEAGLSPFNGPIPWQGWRDHNLDDLEQDLLFESWLVPFQDQKTGAWTLQPASLTLLYWAGRLLEVWDPLPDPKGFIDMHDWHGWFGGRL